MNEFNLKSGNLITIEYKNKPGELITFNTLLETKYDDKNFLIMAPMYYGAPFLFDESETITVVFTHITNDHRFLTFAFQAKTVDRLRIDDLPYLKIRRVSPISKKQGRGFFRLDYMKEIFCQIEKGRDDYADLTLTSKDISGGGLRAICNTKVKNKAKAIVYLDIGKKVLQLKGVVVNVSKVPDSLNKYDLRIEFNGNKKHDITDLVRFILEIESKYLKKIANAKHEERMESFGSSIYYENNKRNDKDWLINLLDVSVVLNWFLYFVIIANFLLARPEWRFGIQSFWGYEVRNHWDKQILYRNMNLFIAVFLISSISLFLNMFRMKRKGDHYRLTLVVSTIVSLIALIIYRLFFGILFS